MTHQTPQPPSVPSKKRTWLPIAIIAAVLVAAAPAAWVLAVSPWERSAGEAIYVDEGEGGARGGLGAKGDKGAPGPLPVTLPTPAPRAPFFETFSKDSAASGGTAVALPVPGSAGSLETADRQIISQANLSLEVTAVAAVVGQVQAIAQSLGGFVEQLSSSGAEEKQFAAITIRLPQAEFFTAMDRLRALGKVQSENLGSQDVTEQFIDLEARLKSLQREEESLLALLGRAQQISEILTIERELSRVRSDIERYQGQLNFLKRRVDLATITISLFPPQEKVSQPPFGALTVEAESVSASVEEVKALASRLKGEIDSLSLSVKAGRTRADISLRVFSKDFNGAMATIEGEGKVLSKEVLEGAPVVADGEAKPAEKPNAPINVTLVEPEKNALGRIIAIALWAGSGALVVLAGLLLYFVYRLRRRKGMAATQRAA
ncbi:MAG: DUF4349 domain-containing protein [Chloroflexi bacterium]|nr:DUF4349 domain-containing protein [Chloroflexota bacterium]